jgi:hypothetical protein
MCILCLFFRRKHYTLYEQPKTNIPLHHNESNFDSVEHLRIESGQSIISSKNYFRNTTAITFKDDCPMTYDSIAFTLSHSIPLKQLTTLFFECEYFSVQKILKILCCTPNIHTLKLKTISGYQNKNDDTLVEKNEDFHLVSDTNVITNVTFEGDCTLDKIKLLVTLCPRMEHLTIKTRSKTLESILRFLLDRTNQRTSHLCSLCFSRVYNDCLEKAVMLIKSEALLNDYTLKKIAWKLYLWW